MGNDEFKEIMEEVYKILREKIITRLGDYLSDDNKKILYSFDLNKNIIITNIQNRIVEYDRETETINISDGFLTEEYILKTKLKNSYFDIEKLKEKISNGSLDIILEELIVFSDELKIKEKDIIKSLYTQEILRSVLETPKDTLCKKVVMDGVIELIAHEIGSQNGFIVSTPKKKFENLEVAFLLKEEFGKKFDNIIFTKNIDDIVENLENTKLKKKIDGLIDDEKVIESTQNLDEVVNSINEVVDEVSQISIVEMDKKQLIKFIDEKEEVSLFESSNNDKFLDIFNDIKGHKQDKDKVTKSELLKALDLYEHGEPLYKVYDPNRKEVQTYDDNEKLFETGKIHINPDEGIYVKEAIVEIKEESETPTPPFTREPQKEDTEFKEMSEKFNEDKSLTFEEINKMNDYIDSKGGKNILDPKRKRKVIISVIGVVLIVALGVFLGWLLFTLK